MASLFVSNNLSTIGLNNLKIDKLGRPKGKKSTHYKLTGKEKTIIELHEKGLSKSKIAKILDVHRNTLNVYIKQNGINLSWYQLNDYFVTLEFRVKYFKIKW